MKKWLALAVLLVLVLALFAFPVPISAAPDWDYYRNVTISNSSGSALTGYQVPVHITDTTDMADNGADLRFTNGGNTVKYSYYVRSWAEDDAYVTVKVSSIPTGDSTMRMWYGNSQAASESSGTDTFEWFDNFDTDTIANYTTSGTVEWQADGTMKITNGYIRPSGFTIANAFVHMTFKQTAAPEDSSGTHIVAKAIDASNTVLYAAGFGSLNDDTLALVKKVGGVQSTVGSTTYTLDLGTWYTLRIGWSGTTYKPYDPDNTLVDSFTIGDAVFQTSSPILFRVNDGTSYLTKVRVLKYIDPPPTYAIGGQTAAGGEDPIPELPTILLLVSGMAVLAGYLILQRRRMSSQRA